MTVFDFTPPAKPEAPSPAEQLMAAQERLSLLFDSADGMRRDLEARGWSPTIAEQLAAGWLSRVMMGG